VASANVVTSGVLKQKGVFTMRLRLFVLGLLFFVVGKMFGQQGNPGSPDAIFYNGKIITVDSDSSIQQAFAVKGEEFVAVGTNAKVRALAGKGTRLVDLKGAAVIPGMSDNHDHLYNSGKYMRHGVDMLGVTSLPEMLARLRQGVTSAKPGETVFTTTGWRVQPGPTKKDLDQISTEVPIVVIGSRRGNGMLNSAALKLVGITKEMPSYAGIPAAKDANGEPTGAIPGYPAAVMVIDKLLPPLNQEAEEELILKGQQQRNALGITSIRELQVWPEVMRAYYRLWRQGKLTLRVAMGVEFPDQASTAKNLELLGVAVPFGDHWMRMDSVGEEPWTPNYPIKPYTELLVAMNRLGWRPAPHVSADPARGTGPDEATTNTLDAYEAADRVAPIKEKRWYVEHVPFATSEQMDRMAKLGLMISIQDAGYSNAEFAIRIMGKDRAERQNPVREFLDHHLVVIGGSDYGGPTPDEMNPNNPFIPFYFYVTRKAKNGTVAGVDEKISREQALRIFTANPAYATFEEKVKGSIEPGKLADFVILSQDIMTVPDDQILATHPVATYVGGRKVFAAEKTNF
jgi:predicted amidohydrolase YtcJ